MKSIIYIRTSTEEQEPENQIKDCEKLVKDDYILLEDKQSAFKDKDRENFEKAKKLIKANQINHFVVWDLDRIYRNRIKLKEFFEFCKIYKCEIHSVNQKWLEDLNKIPSPFNEIMHDLMLNLMGWLAEDESKKKSERVKLAVRKKDGKTISYKGNKWGRKSMHTNKIKRIIELRKEGLSYRDISEKEKISIGKISQIVNTMFINTPHKNPHKNPLKKGVQQLVN